MNQHAIQKIEYSEEACGLKLSIKAMSYEGEDNWYMLTDDRSERWVRLYGPNSLQNLVTKFVYLNSHSTRKKACVHSDRDGLIQYRGVRHSVKFSPLLSELPKYQREMTGVRQRSSSSGTCWYAADCWVLQFSPQMRDLIHAKSDPEFHEKVRGILSDQTRAETFRRYLFEKYKLGDRPDQPPHLDGQNGWKQLEILFANLDIPIVRFLAPPVTQNVSLAERLMIRPEGLEDAYEITDPVSDQENRPLNIRSRVRDGETSLLVVRCFRTRWRASPQIKHNNRLYKFVGATIGSEYCGHQVGVSVADVDSSVMGVSDADALYKGIGPLFWRTRRRDTDSDETYAKRWRRNWQKALPATRFGASQVCDFNPTNRPSKALEDQRTDDTHVGRVNVDYLYIHIP